MASDVVNLGQPIASEGLSNPGRTALNDGERKTLAELLTAPKPRRQETPYDALEEDNREITAGYTYLGQFINHDITPSTRPKPGSGPPPSAALDLGALYGRGPDEQASIYCQPNMMPEGMSRWHLRLSNAIGGTDVNIRDFYRFPEDKPEIGELRNDENVIIAQLHSSFSMFHNRMLSDIAHERFDGVFGPDAFKAARTAVRWHYQWLVLWDFLPRVCGGSAEIRTLLADLGKASPPEKAFTLFDRLRCAGPYIPDEFSRAVFRFGHAMVRPTYFLNDRLRGPSDDTRPQIHEPIPFLDPNGGFHKELDLRGRQKIPRQWGVNWPYFFPFDVPLAPWDDEATLADGVAPEAFPGPQASMLILPRLLRVFGGLSPQGDSGPPSLIERDLLAGEGLPAAQAVAAKAGINLSDGPRLLELPQNLRTTTPLFYYVLKEADETMRGRCLGKLGRRVVIETLVGVLWRDPESFLSQDANWRPTAPAGGAVRGQPYTMAHFLKYAFDLEANPVVPKAFDVPPAR